MGNNRKSPYFLNHNHFLYQVSEYSCIFLFNSFSLRAFNNYKYYFFSNVHVTMFFFCYRLIGEGKLMDALALSDRFLRNGASDQLLQLVIERAEEIHSNSAQRQGHGGHNIWSNSWQYCLRLKDKQLAARLALR